MYIHTHTYVCVHTYAYIHMNAYTCVHVGVYACFLCVSVSVCTRVRECINSKKIAHPQIHTNIPHLNHTLSLTIFHIFTLNHSLHTRKHSNARAYAFAVLPGGLKDGAWAT